MGTKVINCRVQNVLGVSDVELSPDGESVTIGGPNGCGKSSALWALCMALGGKALVPEKPVKDGAKVGLVDVELEEFTVHWEVDAGRNVKLRVKGKDGTKFGNERTFLDRFFSSLSFDPGAFKQMDDKKRFQMLSDVVKVDLKPIEGEIKELEEDRRMCGQEGKKLAGKVADRQIYEDVPETETSIAELSERLREVQAHNQRRIDQLAAIRGKETQAAGLADENRRLLEQIEALNARVNQNQARREELSYEGKDIEAALISDRGEEAEKLFEQVQNAEVVNRKVRENIETQALQEQLEAERKRYEDYTQKIQALRDKRGQLLSEANFPIDGLSLTENGEITFNGVPWEQISESQRWVISLSIGFALNPMGIVFMRESGGLDRKSRDMIRTRAAELGVQLFLEVVDDADDVQILIEEGRVKADRTKQNETKKTS